MRIEAIAEVDVRASPFPRIDPIWRAGDSLNCHLTFLVKLSEALMDQLPEPDSARIGGETVTRAVGTLTIPLKPDDRAWAGELARSSRGR